MKNLANKGNTSSPEKNAKVKISETKLKHSHNEGKKVLDRNLHRTYLKQISHHNLLTREEEQELGKRAYEGNDEEAINKLVTSNLRLVAKIATDFNRTWNKNIMDLIQEGNLGLMQAARKFDPSQGTKFSYYASFWIKAYMLKFIMGNWKLVKVGTTQNQRKLFFNLAKEKSELQAAGFIPEPKLIAKRLDVKEEEVIEMSKRLESGDISLSAPVSEESKGTYDAYLKDSTQPVDERLSKKQRRKIFLKKLEEFRGRLPKREAEIFDSRIMAEDPLVLREIGDKYHISKERVRQIQMGIVENIARWSHEEIPNFEEDYNDYRNPGAEMLRMGNA